MSERTPHLGGEQVDRNSETHARQVAILDFLDWVHEKHGGMLMQWLEHDEPEPCTGWGLDDCKGDDCRGCKGTGERIRHHEGYFIMRTPSQQLVYEYFGIDPDKLEQERRELLRELRDGPVRDAGQSKGGR